MRSQINDLYEFGPFRVDPRERLLLRDCKPIAITPKAFDTLLVLLGNSGHLMLKDELLKAVWPDSFVEEVNLSQNISTLRRALGDTAQESHYIATVPGKGYRFIAEVKIIQPPEEEVESRQEQPSPAEGTEARPHRIRTAIVGTMALLLILFLGGYRLRNAEHPKPAAAAVKPRRSVAVLGFQNLSGRPDPAWLSTAFSEMLATELEAGEQLRLVSSEETTLMRTSLPVPNTGTLSPSTLAQIHQATGADLVVLGSYSDLGRESGGKIRLDLRVQDTQAGDTIATISETGTEAGLFQLVSTTGADLRTLLGVAGPPDGDAVALRNSLPASPEAARLYAEGLAKLRVFDALAARDLLGQAIEADPKYALAHSALSEAWSTLGYDQKAVDEAKKAFELSQNLTRRDRLFIEARYRVMNKEWAKAVQLYQSLFDFFPDDVEYGLRLADTLTQANKKNEAMAAIQAMRKLPAPLGGDVRIDLAEEKSYTWAGDYKTAQQAATRAVEKARAGGISLLLARALWRESVTLVNQGEADTATAAAQEAQNIYATANDQFGVTSTFDVIGSARWYRGDYEGCTKIYQEALAINQRIGNQGGAAHDLAYIGSALGAEGNVEGARRIYEKVLTVDREIGDQNGTAYAFLEIAWALEDEGHPADSVGMYDQALAIFHELSDEDGTASALANKAGVWTTMGELKNAQQAYEQALTVFQRNGNKNMAARTLWGLGNVANLRGDAEEARKAFSQGLSMSRATGDQAEAAHIALELADLSTEEGQLAEAKQQINQTMEYLHRQKDADDQVNAQALLAAIALKEGNATEAERIIESAQTLVHQNKMSMDHFIYTITDARVQTATGKLPQARQALNGVIAETRRQGYLHYQLEARLALCELDAKTNRATARAQGQTLAKEAAAKGFGVIARKALAVGS